MYVGTAQYIMWVLHAAIYNIVLGLHTDLAIRDTVSRHTAKLEAVRVHTHVSNARLRERYIHVCGIQQQLVHVETCMHFLLT